MYRDLFADALDQIKSRFGQSISNERNEMEIKAKKKEKL